MQQIKDIFRVWVPILIITAACGCAATDAGRSGTSGPQPEMGAAYQPKPPLGITTPEAAKADLNVLLNQGRKWGIRLGSGRHYSDVDLTSWSNVHHMKALTQGVKGLTNRTYYVNKELAYMIFKGAPVLDDRIELAPRIPFFYDDLSEYTIAVTRHTGIKYNYAVPFGNRISFLFDYLAEARRFADDLFVIQQSLGREREERRARFEARVAEYRSMAVKPPVTEEQRKYIVQANARSKRKEYLDAIDLYRKAVDIDPVSYPAAYFNMALLSGQLRQYSRAITYMKQYLMLVPDAPDARSAQDKIYEWEMLTQERQP